MKKIKFLAPVFIAIVIFVILFLRIDFANTLEAFGKSNKILLILSPLILFVAQLLGALRWRAVLSILNYEDDFKNIFKLYLASIPISKIAPSNSGNFIRAYYLKDKISPTKHAGGILMESVLEVAILAVFAIIMGFIMGFKLVLLFGFFILISTVVFFLIMPRVRWKVFYKWQVGIDNFFDIFRNSFRRPRLLFSVIFYTFLIWLVVMMYIKISFLAFGSDVSFFSILALQPIVIFVSLLPITIWGVGTREPAMLFLFAGLAPAPTILAVGLTHSFIGAVLLPLLLLPLTYKIMREVIFSQKQVR